MTVAITIDTSNIVDGQNIDAADVTLPLSQLETALEDTLNGIQPFDRQSFGTPETLTISSGIITVTKTHVTVDTQGFASTDDLDTINGGVNGRILFIRCTNNSRNVVLKHGTGNIRTPTGNDYILNSTDLFAYLIHNGTAWIAVLVATNQYLNLGFDSTLIISSGSIIRTRNRHLVDTEGATSTDELISINSGVEGDVLYLSSVTDTRVVTVKHGAGNIRLVHAADRVLNDPQQLLQLVFDGIYWCEPGVDRYEFIPSLLSGDFWRESASAATYASTNMAAGTNTGAGAVTNGNDSEETYVSQAIAASAGTFGGRRTTTFNLVRRAHNPIFEAVIKTGSDITNIRFWIGLFQAAPTNVDTLAASTAAMAFRYSTVAADAGWIAICNDGTSQAFAGTTVSTIAANTRYKLRIRVNNNLGVAYFSVNDSPEVGLGVNLPSLTQDLGAVVTAITTTASAKQMIISRYGCRYGT